MWITTFVIIKLIFVLKYFINVIFSENMYINKNNFITL